MVKLSFRTLTLIRLLIISVSMLQVSSSRVYKYIDWAFADTDNASEIVLRAGQLCIIKLTLMNTPAENILNEEDIVVYAKTGMNTTYPCYVDKPNAGVSVVWKQEKCMQ